MLRSDNGLNFQSRRFLQACRDSRLAGVHHAATFAQNGIIERFFQALKDACVWQYVF